MSNSITTPDRQELKLSAQQIETECPARLRDIAGEIRVRRSKAYKQMEDAEDHLIAVEQLFAEAKSLCDDGGFEKFRELYFPDLGKSQAYALQAIATGKKSLAQHRTEERDRKRRTRARQRAMADDSGTVTEASEPGGVVEDSGTAPESFGTAAEVDDVPSIAFSEDTDAAETENETLGPGFSAKRAPAVKDPALDNFTDIVCRLGQMTSKQIPQRFAETGVRSADLAKLGGFLSAIAELKSKPSAMPPGTVERGVPEHSGRARTTPHAALDAEPVR